MTKEHILSEILRTAAKTDDPMSADGPWKASIGSRFLKRPAGSAHEALTCGPVESLAADRQGQ
jgi:hypothetical protein